MSTQREATCVEGAQKDGLPEDGGPVPVSVRMRADYQGESAGGRVIGFVPVQFAAKGDAANLQNEIVDDVLSEAARDGRTEADQDDQHRASEPSVVYEGGGGGSSGARDLRSTEAEIRTEDAGRRTGGRERGAEEICGRADGRVRDPRRTDWGFQVELAGVGVIDCVPVESTGKGDVANVRNEMEARFDGSEGEVTALMNRSP